MEFHQIFSIGLPLEEIYLVNFDGYLPITIAMATDGKILRLFFSPDPKPMHAFSV